MNLDHQPENSRIASVAVWICSFGCIGVVLGYIAWLVFGDSLTVDQSQLHPVPVLQIIFDQVMATAPPWEWNVPLWSILVWLVWLVGTWGAGWLLLRWIWPADSRTPESVRAVLAFVIGFCITGVAQEILGILGIVAFPLFLLGDLALLIALRTSTGLRRDLVKCSRAVTWQWRSATPVVRLFTMAAAFAAALMLVPALTPPIQSDAVRYHLGAPQEYLKLGYIGYLPLNAYSNMPFLVEMHFMAALACRAPEATQLMHFTLAVMVVLAIYTMLRLQSRRATNEPCKASSLLIFAPALYFFTPMSAVLATWPFTDHGISLMLVASLVAMLICTRSTTDHPRHWIILGICLGGLVGTKYTMGPIAVVILMTTLVSRWKSPAAPRPLTTHIGNAAIAGMFCLAVSGIWFLKNLYLTGNPFYPLASSIFRGGEWTAINDKFLHTRAGLKGMGSSAGAFLSAPWNATFQWIPFESHNPGATLLISLLIAISGVVVCWNRPCLRERAAIAVVIFASIIVWFFSYQSNRLLLPTIAAALCLTPVHAMSTRKMTSRILAAAILLSGAVSIAWAVQWSWIATALSPRPLPYLLGQQDAATYRYKSLTYARAFDFLNEHVLPNETVLLVGEHRIFGAKFNAYWSDWFDVPALAVILRREHIGSTDALLEYLRTHRFNWILINEAELAPQLEQSFKPWFTPQEWQIFEQLRTLDRPGIQRLQFPPGVTVLHLEPES